MNSVAGPAPKFGGRFAGKAPTNMWCVCMYMYIYTHILYKCVYIYIYVYIGTYICIYIYIEREIDGIDG